jgi:hypothetical protein
MIGNGRIYKQNKSVALWILSIVAVLTSFALLNLFAGNAFAAQAELSNSDCVKCHPAVAAAVEKDGGKHKTAVTCMNCHKGHPPMVSKEKIIPACSMCHSGKPHFQIGGCSTCHSNPHTPLKMKLAANLTAPCVSCHQKEGNELKDHPTLHSKLFCTTCHKAHKQVPSCLECHQPHSAEMVNKDCVVCHPAHQPRTITYGPKLPSTQCAACHKGIYDTLLSVGTKHSKLACVFCHKDKHGFVPACEMCHGKPHPETMLKHFPKCIMCHISAHSLGKEVKK